MALANRGAPAAPLLPRLRSAEPGVVLRWADDLCLALERELAALRAPGGRGAYDLPNFAPSPRTADPAGASRSLDPAAATSPQTAAVLATLILDLRTKGVIS